MPEEQTKERAREDEREGKSPSTQAGEFVREEMEHIREGEHGARSTKQAIAIGLSKARRAGVKLPPPKKGAASKRTRRQAKRDLIKGGNAEEKLFREHAREPQKRRSSAKVEERLPGKHSPGRPVPSRENAHPPNVPLRRKKLLGPGRRDRNFSDRKRAFARLLD